MLSRGFIGFAAFAAIGFASAFIVSGQEKTAPETKSGEARPSESPSSRPKEKAGHQPEKKQAEDQPSKAKTRRPEAPKVALAFVSPVGPVRTMAGVSVELVCRMKIETPAWEPGVGIFQISPPDQPNVSYGSVGTGKFTRKGDVAVFKAQLKAPKRPGIYTISARVFGIDTRIPAPPFAPGPDGKRHGKSGAVVSFDAPRQIRLIVEGPGELF